MTQPGGGNNGYATNEPLSTISDDHAAALCARVEDRVSRGARLREAIDTLTDPEAHALATWVTRDQGPGSTMSTGSFPEKATRGRDATARSTNT